jgi:MFS transporter, SHS family, sialic acid transporter
MSGSSSQEDSTAQPARPTRGAKLALVAALLGWMFDGAEMGVFSLVGRPALKDLLPPGEEANIAKYLGIIIAMFLVGAATGGVLFGWLGDRIGRVRAMMLSVMCYAVFTALCGIASGPIQLGVLRFIASLGMGGEWALGVALVMEIWPNRTRAFMAGLIGAAANVGYVLIAVTGLALSSLLEKIRAGLEFVGSSPASIEYWTSNSGWRLLMVMGIVPALLTFFIRLFVPESDKWKNEQQQGKTSHWATLDLLGVLLGALGPIMMVITYVQTEDIPLRVLATLAGIAIAIVGYTYPVVRYLQRLHKSKEPTEKISVSPIIRRMLLAACLSGIALLGTWGSVQNAPAWVDQNNRPESANYAPHAREYTLMFLSLGAVAGTLVSAWLGEKIGRRPAYFVQCVLSLGSVILLFQGNQQYGNLLLASAFVAGACTASFYGWLPLYLPELFGTNIRATGQGFGFNFGRILAAAGSLQLGALTQYFGGYPTACTSLSMVYLLGMVLIWFAPETKGKPLPD